MSAFPAGCWKKRAGRVGEESSCQEIRIEDLLEHVIERKLLLLSALGAEPKNGSSTILKVVFDLQIRDRADPAAGAGKRGK